jgi:5-formyltetrahydrofolate cyclo-ligase
MSALNHQHRQALKALRASLHDDDQIKIAHAIFKRFVDTINLSDYTYIACYLAHNSEVRTDEIIHFLWQHEKQCYLPVISSSENQPLTFHLYTPSTPLIKNVYGILEPANSLSISIQALDCVIMPLVAFDGFCHRIGMGGGYYDRSFAFRQVSKRPYLIGLAYDMQKIPRIEPNPWDIALDMVITESEIIVHP